MNGIDASIGGWDRVMASATAAYERSPNREDGLVGVVGADVPVELLEAAGCGPYALNGVPGAEATSVGPWLEPAVDGAARSVLHELLAGRYTELSHVVFGHDCEGTVRAFMTMRELAQTGAMPSLPHSYLVDVQRLPRNTSTRYNASQLEGLREKLASWGYSDSDDLVGVIARVNGLRRRLRQLAEARRYGGISGADALTLIGACRKLPTAEAASILERALEAMVTEDADLCRVYVTGMDHHSPGLYRLLESCGSVVVGEDHAWGGGWGVGLIDEDREPIEAIAGHYQSYGAGSAGRSIQRRADETVRSVEEANANAVVCFVRPGDHAPHWDIPAQRRDLAERGIPMLVIETAAFDDEMSEGALDLVAGFLEAVRTGSVPSTTRVTSSL